MDKNIHQKSWLIGVWAGRLFVVTVALCASAVVVVATYAVIKVILGVCGG